LRRVVAHALAPVVRELGDEAAQLLQARTSIRIPEGTVVTFDERRLITSFSKSSRPGAEGYAFENYSSCALEMAFRSRLSRIVDYGPEGNVYEIMQRSGGA